MSILRLVMKTHQLRRVTLVSAVALFLTAEPAAADFIAVPNAFANAPGDDRLSTLFRSLDRTFQTVIGASQLTAIQPGSLITGFSFRLDEGETAFPTVPLTFPQYNIQLSTSLNAAGALSNTFANNIGPGVVLVRSGPLTLPPNSYVPGPGVDPFGFVVPFTTPYTYLGDNLLITVRLQGNGVDDRFFDANTNIAGVIQTIGATSFTGTVNDNITGFFSPIYELQFSQVPEPSTLTLLSLGAVLLGYARRR